MGRVTLIHIFFARRNLVCKPCCAICTESWDCRQDLNRFVWWYKSRASEQADRQTGIVHQSDGTPLQSKWWSCLPTHLLIYINREDCPCDSSSTQTYCAFALWMSYISGTIAWGMWALVIQLLFLIRHLYRIRVGLGEDQRTSTITAHDVVWNRLALNTN